MRVIPRLVYFVAGVSGLYMAIAPTLSGLSNLRPLWVTIAFWCGAILLIVAALATQDIGCRMAAVGSSIIVAMYCCLGMMPVVVQLGFYHLETRLVAAHEAPRWRYDLDRPVLFLLLFAALISLGISIQAIVAGVRRRPAQDGASGLAK